ncbi:uncharacterized protein [Bemisia tabaci]|uniref:uncharacterized protein n=1 Tax=Bemisia tabaci TaxID=7038 RepID=UPI003B283BD6
MLATRILKEFKSSTLLLLFTGTFVSAKSCNMEGHDVNLTLEESTCTERFIFHKRIKGEHETVDALPFTLKHGSFQKNCIQKFDEKSGCNDLHNSAKESFVDNNYSISLEIEGNSRRHTQLRKAEDVFDYDGFIDPAFLQVTNQEERMTVHPNEKIRVQYERHTSLILDPKLKPCIVKNSTDGRFKFDFYSESFRTNGSKKTHNVSHSDERPFKCEECHAFFKRKRCIRTHMLAHSDEKSFKCELCSASFKGKYTLKSHSASHSDEKPFKCEKCPAIFKLKHYLKSHSTVHSDERPFKCELCSASFKTKCNLRAHSISHSDEKPFKCEKCPLTFKTKSNLGSHRLAHSDERLFKCELCSASFKTKWGVVTYRLT